MYDYNQTYALHRKVKKKKIYIYIYYVFINNINKNNARNTNYFTNC